MNPKLQGLWDWWYWHRNLTGDLLDVLDDAHLAFVPGEALPSMAKLCADMADTQRAYVDSLETRTLDFDAPLPSDPPASVAALRSTFTDLDRQLSAALQNLGDDPDAVRIRRDDEELPVFILMSSLVESLLIFHGKLSVYARLAGVDLPSSWSRYI